MAEEFDEEEVWATVMEKKDDSPETRKQKDASFSSHFSPTHKPSSSAPAGQGWLSAPVNIPKCSQTYKRHSSLNACVEGGGSVASEDEEDEEEEMFPPHELLARKMARNKISSSSVCEGAGRTLKGRDQRKVRDAVFSKTGFLE